MEVVRVLRSTSASTPFMMDVVWDLNCCVESWTRNVVSLVPLELEGSKDASLIFGECFSRGDWWGAAPF